MNTAAAREAVMALDLKPNSVVFLDASAIDVEELFKLEWPAKMPRVYLVPVVLDEGQSFQDAVSVRSLPEDVLEVYRAMTAVLTAEQINAVTAKVMESRGVTA